MFGVGYILGFTRRLSAVAHRNKFKQLLAAGCIGIGTSFSVAAQMEFGVNGHYGVYPLATLSQQFDLLEDMGATAYRLDVYGYDAGGMNALRAAVRYAGEHGVSILPVLVIKPNAAETPQQHYARAYDLAYGVASRLPAIKVWELGNELDIYALIKACEVRDNGKLWQCNWGSPSGADVMDYESTRFEQVKALIRGLGDGVRAAIPDAKRIVDTAGWLHYGFLQRLMDDGVSFEITGYHWYSDHGDMESAGGKNVLQILANMGKPIWLTELNRRYGSYGSNGEAAQSDWVEKSMARYKQVADKYNLRMAFVYELFDEPWIANSNGHYGLLKMTKNSTGSWVVSDKKPVYYAFKRQAATGVASLPDLVVTGVSVPSAIKGGQRVVFQAQIKNQGNSKVTDTFPLGFLVDGQFVNWTTVTVDLAPGQSATLKATWGPKKLNYWTATAGAHKVTAWVDDQNAVPESSDANNQTSVNINVAAGASPDLVVTSLSVPKTAKAGAKIVFKATIKNQGKAAVTDSFPLGFLVDGKFVNWTNVQVDLGVGRSATLSATWGPNGVKYWTAAKGKHTVTAWVDDQDRIVESSNANNRKSATVTVK